MPSHHDYGIDAEHFCGGTPDDDEWNICDNCGRCAPDVTLQRPCEESDSTAYLCADSAACNQRCRENDDDLALNAADVPYPATIYYCTVCGRNEVDAGSGFDTCQECLARQ